MSLLRLIALLVVSSLTVAILWPQILTQYDPYAMRPEQRLQRPSGTHWFGTDQFGRDVFTRVVYGARPSIGLALLVVALASVLGGAVGLVAGYVGSVVEGVAMRVVDVFLAFPQLILAIAIAAALGQGKSDPVSLDTGLTNHDGDQGGRHGEESAEADDSARGGAGGPGRRGAP